MEPPWNGTIGWNWAHRVRRNALLAVDAVDGIDPARTASPNIVGVMDDLSVGRFTIPDAELEEEFGTSGGPGGQHANRSNTAVEVRFRPGDSTAFPDDVRDRIVQRLGDLVTATSSESRSQWRNRALARQRLVEKLEAAIKPPPRRKPTKPTRASKRRRLEAKRRRSEKKRLRQDPEW